MEFNKFNHIELMIKSLYYDSEKAFKFLKETLIGEKELPKEVEKRNELISGILLNSAISTYSSLHSFYYCNYAEVQDDKLEHIFSRFEIFSREFFNNISTSHSHYQTFIEFDNFIDSIKKYGVFPIGMH